MNGFKTPDSVARFDRIDFFEVSRNEKVTITIMIEIIHSVERFCRPTRGIRDIAVTIELLKMGLKDSPNISHSIRYLDRRADPFLG
jgi:hypothetical protein